MEDLELLKYLEENGMIDLDAMRIKVMEMKNEQYLKLHPYTVWQGKDGKWYTYLPDRFKKRKLVKRSTEKDIKAAIIFYYENDAEVHTFQAYYEKWVDRQRKCGIAEQTIQKYESDYKRFFELDSGNIVDKDIGSITEGDIEDYIFRLLDRVDIKYKAFRQMFSMLNNIFKQAMRHHVINENPCDKIDIGLFKRRCKEDVFVEEKRVLDDVGCRKVLDILSKDYEKKPNYIPSYSLELAMLTGMRAGELAFLRWEHIKYDEGYILVEGSEKFNQKTKEYWDDTTKTKKIRRIPLSEDMVLFFRKLYEVEKKYGYLTEHVFSDENGRVRRGRLISCAQHKCEQAGVSARGLQVARRTFNSQLRLEGVPGSVAASILGHSEDVNNKFYTYDISNMDYKLQVVNSVNKKMTTFE